MNPITRAIVNPAPGTPSVQPVTPAPETQQPVPTPSVEIKVTNDTSTKVDITDQKNDKELSEEETRFKYMSEYERPLLSIALKNPMRLAELRHKINDEYFLFKPNKIIYKSLCTLVENPDILNIDLTALHIESNKHGFENSGAGPQYLMLLDQSSVDESNFHFYLGKVENAYRKYKLDVTLRHSLDKLQKHAKDDVIEDNVTGKDLIDQTAAKVTQLNLETSLDEEVIDISGRALPYVEERAEGENIIKGLPTGFDSLDRAINGLLPGTLTVIGGRAKDGKSTLLMNIVNHLGVPSPDKDFDPVPILVISTEMYTDEDISRLIAMSSLVEERKIANGSAWNDPVEQFEVSESIKNIQNAKIYHRYMPSFNAEEVCSLINFCKLRYGIKLAIFDYIKMETKNASRDKREDQILGDITNALKMSAGELYIPVVTACQINSRSDRIADSDRIARYADVILEFRSKEEDELEAQQPVSQFGTHWITITHSRRGGKRKIPVSFYKPCLKLLEAEYFTEEESETEGRLSLADSLTTPKEVENSIISKFQNGVVNTPSYTPNDIVNTATQSQLEDDDPMF